MTKDDESEWFPPFIAWNNYWPERGRTHDYGTIIDVLLGLLPDISLNLSIGN